MPDDFVEWVLYVDESGDFRVQDQNVVVGAVLMRAGIATHSPQALRTALDRAVPALPWPLHASVLDFASFVAFALPTVKPAARSSDMARGVEQVVPPFSSATFVRFLLETLAAEHCHAIADAARTGNEPSHTHLWALDRVLLQLQEPNPSAVGRQRKKQKQIQRRLIQQLRERVCALQPADANAIAARDATVHEVFTCFRDPSRQLDAPFRRQFGGVVMMHVEKLKAHGHLAWTAAQRLLPAVTSARNAAMPMPVALMLSAELRQGDLWARDALITDPDEAEFQAGGTRYRSLLACLIERAGDLLARIPAARPHRVSLYVLNRPDFPRIADLIEVLQGLRNRWPAGRARAEVRLWAGEVRRFAGNDLDPRYVLADFVANRTRGIVGNVTAELGTIETDLVRELSVPVRSGPENHTRSHLAAGGDARSWVRRGMHYQPMTALPWTGERRKWACMQAWEWMKGDRA